MLQWESQQAILSDYMRLVFGSVTVFLFSSFIHIDARIMVQWFEAFGFALIGCVENKHDMCAAKSIEVNLNTFVKNHLFPEYRSECTLHRD